MSDALQQLLLDMAQESTLDLVNDVKRLRELAEFATSHTIREVRVHINQLLIEQHMKEEEMSNES